MDLFLLLILICLAGDPRPDLSGNLQPQVLIYGPGHGAGSPGNDASPGARRRFLSTPWKPSTWVEKSVAERKDFGGHVEGTQFLTRGAPGILDPSCSFQITVFLFVLDTWLFSLVSADNVILLYFPSIPPSRYF